MIMLKVVQMSVNDVLDGIKGKIRGSLSLFHLGVGGATAEPWDIEQMWLRDPSTTAGGNHVS